MRAPKHSDTKKPSLDFLAGEYFSCLGRYLPQPCASDEFYFLPRAEAALDYLDILDNLTPDKIQDHVRYVQSLLQRVFPGGPNDLEEKIDHLFLKQSMEGFIMEFHEVQSWRRDPTLYIKIPLFALDQILSRIDNPQEQTIRSLFAVFNQLPGFLEQGLTRFYGGHHRD